jgi:hypothetical protein
MYWPTFCRSAGPTLAVVDGINEEAEELRMDLSLVAGAITLAGPLS